MGMEYQMDSRFKVVCEAKTTFPQRLVCRAKDQDYSELFVGYVSATSNEPNSGKEILRCLLAGDRGHFGPLEHPSITLSCGYFPHSVMQQARTHRVGVSFDVQSFRYTGKNVIRAAERELPLEDVFYLRPVGKYRDRQGKVYTYGEEWRERDLEWCLQAAKQYLRDVALGMSYEHARGKLPFDYRQHFVVSFNMRSLMHFLDLRAKKDAQLEIQQLCELIFPHFEVWAPDIAAWYKEHRWGKARLSP